MIATTLLAYPLPWLLALLAIVAVIVVLHERKTWREVRRASKHLNHHARRRSLSDGEVERTLYPHASRRRSA